MTFGLVGTLGLIGFLGYRYIKTKKIEPKLLVISFLIFVTWALYLISPFSTGAAGGQGDLLYLVLNELVSTRYIVGTLFVTELFFIYLLWRIKVPQVFIFSFVGISIISRYWILFPSLPRFYDYTLLTILLILVVGMFLFGRYSKKFVPNIIVLSIIGISIFFIVPTVVEDNRAQSNWLWQWHDIVLYLYLHPSTTVFFLEDPGNFYSIAYLVYGEKLQHTVHKGSESSLLESISQTEKNQTNYPDYVAALCHPSYLDRCEQRMSKLETSLAKFGYTSIVKMDRGILLQNTN